MLPVLKAISLQRIIEKGGHTKPWVVAVKTNDSTIPYVVKLYTTEQIELYNSVTAEVIANQLAQQFALNVPQAAFIEFDEDFLNQRTPEEQQLLGSKDERIKFGSLLLEPAQMFFPGIRKSLFQNRCSAGIDTLFAFDNLIRNSDRGSKPNLMFYNKDSWLIDHEKAFTSLNTVENELSEWKINSFTSYPEFFYRYHICYNYLKKAKRNTKQSYFEDFNFYLNELNINKLNTSFAQLENYEYFSYKQDINNYLQLIKRNSVIFDTLLKNLISGK